MNEFWTNILRYPRFFISSLIGLLLVILAPLKNVLKFEKFKFLLPVGGILFFSIIISILKKMTGI